MSIREFRKIRNCNDFNESTINLSKFQKEEIKLRDARNYYVKKTSSNFRKSYQLSVAIAKLQGLTNILKVCIMNDIDIYLYIKNTYDLIDKINKIKIEPGFKIIFLDVKNC